MSNSITKALFLSTLVTSSGIAHAEEGFTAPTPESHLALQPADLTLPVASPLQPTTPDSYMSAETEAAIWATGAVVCVVLMTVVFISEL